MAWGVRAVTPPAIGQLFRKAAADEKHPGKTAATTFLYEIPCVAR
jgi:hypothetical protein